MPKNPNKSADVLAKNLKHFRKLHGLTQESFAAKISVPYKHFQNLETGGRSNPQLKTLDRIADALGVPTAELLIDPLDTVYFDTILYREPKDRSQLAAENKPSNKASTSPARRISKDS